MIEVDELEAVGMRKASGTFRIPTGLGDLDHLLGGWSQGYLIVVGGRPSSGKTTLLLNFGRAASIKYRLPAMMISGEMNNRDLQSRLVSAEARVPSHSMRTGQMNDEDWRRVAVTMAAIADAPLQIGTPPDFQIEQLSAEAARLVKKSKLKLLLIDSLQWMIGREARDRASVEHALWRLKTLAEMLKIPIIVTAHTERSREGVSLTSPIAQLSHSDAIERVADVVIILDRPDQDDPENMRAGEADLMVVKNRNGPTATVTVAFQGHYCRFVEMGFMVDGEYMHTYPMFPVDPQEPETPEINSSDAHKTSVHDRQLYQRLLDQIPPDGKVMDWLKNNFMLKAQPLRRLEIVEQVAKAMSLEVIGFDDEEANGRYNDLRGAMENFCYTISYHTQLDAGHNWLELRSPAWGDEEDGRRHADALSAMTDVHSKIVEAYDSFLKTCHKKGIDREAGSEE